MKRILACTFILGFVLLSHHQLMAQNDNPKYNTNQRISDQLKNGSAPGLRYGPQSSKRQMMLKQNSDEGRESFNAKVKKGLGPNIAGGGGSSAGRSAFRKSAARTSSGNMASDQKTAAAPQPPAAAAPKVSQGTEPAMHYDAPKAPPKKQ